MYPNSQWDSAEEEGRYTYGIPIAPQPPENNAGWLYDPNTYPTQPVPTPGGAWVWNGKQWTVTSTNNLNNMAASEATNPFGGPTTPTTPPKNPDWDPIPWNGDDPWGYLPEPFTKTPPSYKPGPGFVPPTFTPPPPFSYKEFAPPTTDSIFADPSYKFRFGEGQKAVEQSAAGRGVLRTGGTLKDIANYGQNAASQEYSNIFKRGVDTHNLGLQQALGTYGTNYGVSRDVFDRLYEGNKAQFTAQQRENELMNSRDFDNFLADYDIFEKNRRRAGDYLFQAAELGR